MNAAVRAIAWQEFKLQRRNRWVVSFAVLFALMTLAISFFGMVTSGYAGFQDFTRTAASVVNLGAFLVPLFALLVGVFSFLSSPEHLELLVTQAHPRGRVLLGRYFGLLLTSLTASLLGFGLPGAVIAAVIGVEGLLDYLAVMAYALALVAVFTGLSVLIALACRRRQFALGVALGVWVFYELVYGLAMLGVTLVAPESVVGPALIGGLLGNPIDTVRVLSLLQVGGPHLFGPAGAMLMKLTGSVTVAASIGCASLAAWIAGPIVIAYRLFDRQDV